MVMSIEFLNYLIFVAIVSSVLVYYSPQYGEKTVVVYVLICSLVGSLSVMACKGIQRTSLFLNLQACSSTLPLSLYSFSRLLFTNPFIRFLSHTPGIGIAIAETVSGVENNLTKPLFYFLIFVLALSVTVQMNYLNKALDTFDTFVVTPVYYVFFTTFVLIASAILFQEWKNLEFSDVLGTVSGFVNVIVAIFMLNAFKNHESNLEEIITNISRPKYETLSSTDETTDTISLKS